VLVRASGENGDRAQAVREIDVPCQVASRGSWRGSLCSGNVAHVRNAAGLHQVIEHVIPGVIDIGIDPVRGQVPGFVGEPYADVPADLADPDRFSLEPEGRKPEPEVQPLVNRPPRPLQREVLAASLDVKAHSPGNSGSSSPAKRI
jgi:hypothetical protein